MICKHGGRVRLSKYDGAWIVVGREEVDLWDVHRVIESRKGEKE